MLTRHRAVLVAVLSGGICLVPGCDEPQGEGTLRVAIYGEELVEQGVPAETFVDGWEVTFSRFLVATSDIAADGEALEGHFVHDLSVASGGEGHAIAGLIVPEGTVEHLSFRVGPARANGLGNAAPQDAATMVEAGYSVWVSGAATRQGTELTFDWGFDLDTHYIDCVTAQPIADAGEATSQITIHADHLFYDDLDSEVPNVAFDLIAQSDGDANGDVTAQELSEMDITGQARYQVGGRAISDLWSFIEAQTTTVGHIDGEGHCDVDRES